MKKLNLNTQITLIGSLTLLLFFTSCSSGTEKKANGSSLPTIDLVEAYDNRTEVSLSTFAEAVEYIPLETVEESLVGNYPSFYLADDKIISIVFRQIYTFDKKSGKFIEEIRGYGEGPNEYLSTKKSLEFNEEDEVFYVAKKPSLIWQLNSSGEKTGEFEIPTDENYIMGFSKLSDKLFVGYNANPTCNQKNKLTIFDSQGKILKTFPNHQSCIHDLSLGISFDTDEGRFYRDRGNVYFKETYNDTLFYVSDDTLSAHLIFDSKNQSIPYEDKTKYPTLESRANFLQPSVIDITQQHIFFQLTTKGQTFNGIFNKETRETLLSDIGRTEIHGFINDLDNFLPFVPQYATDNNQLVGYIEAPDVLAWFKENPDKAAQLPERLKKLGEIKADDNPVVMIVDLKE